MSAGEDSTYTPLTRRSLPIAPWSVRWLGAMNNRWNESIANGVLETRSRSAIERAWQSCFPDTLLVQQAVAAIGREMEWTRAYLFAPDDECFVVFKLWWHGFADCWERERALWAVEKVFDTKVPREALPRLPTITLGELLRLLAVGKLGEIRDGRDFGGNEGNERGN